MSLDRMRGHSDFAATMGFLASIVVALAVLAWGLYGLYVDAFVMLDPDPAECAASRALLFEEFKTRYLLAGGTSTSEPAMLELWKQTEWERKKGRGGAYSLLPPDTPECERRMPDAAERGGGGGGPSP